MSTAQTALAALQQKFNDSERDRRAALADVATATTAKEQAEEREQELIRERQVSAETLGDHGADGIAYEEKIKFLVEGLTASRNKIDEILYEAASLGPEKD